MNRVFQNFIDLLSPANTIYARDQNFHYAMQPDEPLQKASRLITDKRFLLRRGEEE